MTDPTKLARIRAKLAALLAKTVANGCTEDEAMSAAAAAARIMAEHGLTEEEVRRAAERPDADTFAYWMTPGEKREERLDAWAGPAIAIFCEVRLFTVKKRTGPRVRHYAGFAADVELAQFLRAVILRALETEGFVWEFAHMDNRGTREDFEIGMLMRIRERLTEMTKARLDAQPQGRGLTIAKRNAVTDWLRREHDIALRKGRSRGAGRELDPNAYAAGQAAGERVGLGRPIGGAASRAGGRALLRGA